MSILKISIPTNTNKAKIIENFLEMEFAFKSAFYGDGGDLKSGTLAMTLDSCKELDRILKVLNYMAIRYTYCLADQ